MLAGSPVPAHPVNFPDRRRTRRESVSVRVLGVTCTRSVDDGSRRSGDDVLEDEEDREAREDHDGGD
jgi:hypothetical protein